MATVWVLGSMNVDSIVRVERHPAPGETVPGGPLETQFGGKGANQAVAAARAGADVRMIGRVGGDDLGARYLQRLADLGIDASRVRVDATSPTGHAAIAVDAHGENTIIISPGANAAVGTDDLAALDSIQEGDVLLLQLEIDVDVVAAAARLAASRGARVVLNIAPFREVPDDVLNLADPVIANETEAAALAASGATAPSLLITRGEHGSEWGTHAEPATRAAAVVDTTGAGDTYCGVLAARLAAGDEPEAAMHAAAIAAAASVGWPGAQPDPNSDQNIL